MDFVSIYYDIWVVFCIFHRLHNKVEDTDVPNSVKLKKITMSFMKFPKYRMKIVSSISQNNFHLFKYITSVYFVYGFKLKSNYSHHVYGQN